MNYLWSDFVGNIGVFFVLLSYILLQTEKLKSTDLIYSALNTAGAILVLVSLFVTFNLSSFIIEIFWLFISLFGLIKALRSKEKLKQTPAS